MPQTKFVTGKALALGLKPIVVVNKIDRPDGRPQEVLDEVFDLFVSLDANDEQLDFPVLFASGRNGYASTDMNAREGTLIPMFETIVSHVPAPKVEVAGVPFTFLVTLLDRIWSKFDELSEKHGVQKMETVGYTYMAVGGLLSQGNNIQAVEMTRMALDCCEEAASFMQPDGTPLAVKVGLHTGHVLSGVVGSKKTFRTRFPRGGPSG